VKLFVKVDANFDGHPRARRAGHEGRVVIQLVWRLAKRFGRDDGDVTNLWDAGYLATEGGFSAEFAGVGMDACEAVGFVERVGAEVVIHDWAGEQGDQREQWAKRKRRQREKSKTKEDSHGVTRDSVDVTESHVEESRGEERRGETRACDPTTQTATQATTPSLHHVAVRHLQLIAKHLCVTGGSATDWARRYAEHLQQNTPHPPAVAEYDAYAARLLSAVEYAFSEAMRPWSDGTPFRNKLRKAETLCRLLPDIEAASQAPSALLEPWITESPSQVEARLKAKAEANPPPLTEEEIARGRAFRERMRREREAHKETP
jgi:hypothetical protein